MTDTSDEQRSDDSEVPIPYLASSAELEAVKQAIWYHIRFLRRFKNPTPSQKKTERLLESFLRRLPTQ